MVYTYYSNFYLDKYLDSTGTHSVIQMGMFLYLSMQLSKRIQLAIPDIFWASKWNRIFTITPIVIFLAILLIQALVFDAIRNDHYLNKGAKIEANMIDYKYYKFSVNGQEFHGRLKGKDRDLRKEGRKAGERVLIEYSIVNPIINRPE